MATSGSINIPVASWISMKFSWWQNSQSIENNTTTIGWKLECTTTSSGALYKKNRTWTVTIDGKTYTGTVNISLDKSSTQTLASSTATINHNSDGTKTFSFSAKQQFELTLNSGKYLSTYSGSGSDTLPTIARASQPSLVTYPNTTQNVGNFGATFSIHMNRKSSAFTHTVRYEYGSRKGTIATGVGTGTTWAVPLEFMNDIPNATSGSGRIYVDTYNGSTKVGTKYTGFTATVPASVKPTCTIQVLDNTDTQATYGNLVKGLSQLYVKTNFYAAYSSPVKSYDVTANGTKYAENEIVTGVLKAAGTTTITAKVTDKRERTSEAATASFTVLDYKAPAVSKLSVSRCNSDGTANKRGTFAKVVFSASVTALNDKNTAMYKLYYKKTSDTLYTEVICDDITNTYSVTDYTYIFQANAGNSYDVIVEVTDRHNTDNPATKPAKVPTAVSILSWRGFRTANGKEDGIGIGKVPEKANTFQVGWNTEFEEEVSYKGKTLLDFFYPVNSIYISYSHTNPGTLFGGTWVRMSNTFLWGADANGDIGITGGEKTHTLTANEMPSHTHKPTTAASPDPSYPDYAFQLITDLSSDATARSKVASGSNYYVNAASADDYKNVEAVLQTAATGGGAAHNNMPPYTQVSIWRRTA